MATEWYYSSNNQQKGPVTAKVLKELADAGLLEPSDLVWKEGMSEWQPASQVRGLFPQQKTPPPLPSSPPALPHSLVSDTVSASSDARQNSFGEWYRNSLGKLPVILQIPLWLFYGFLWIPLWYLLSSGGGFWTIWGFVPVLGWISWFYVWWKTRHRKYLLYAFLYAIPFLLALAVPTGAEIPEWITNVTIFFWFACIMHLSMHKAEATLRMAQFREHKSQSEIDRVVAATFSPPQRRTVPSNVSSTRTTASREETDFFDEVEEASSIESSKSFGQIGIWILAALGAFLTQKIFEVLWEKMFS